MSGATIKKNLRTGRSLWADSPGLGVPVRPLEAAISVDVAIVGAGISGAFMAHELSRDHTVAVLDRRPPLTGSTVASTALLQWEIDLPLTALAEKIGPAKAKRAYLRSRSAVDALKRWSDDRSRIDSPLLEARIGALGGQTRAAARQTVDALGGALDRTLQSLDPYLMHLLLPRRDHHA